MKNLKIKIDILPNQFLKSDGTFDKEGALKFSGRVAGVCYAEEGYAELENEPEEKNTDRVNKTLKDGHHSVYDHIFINFNLQNVPKILAMALNNEHQYTTSEKSARFKTIIKKEGSIITDVETKLYQKWLNIFQIQIKEKYGKFYSEKKIIKLAQENARYLVTVFMPTQMIYTTSFRQINYIASWMSNYIDEVNCNDLFELKLAYFTRQFLDELKRLNVLEERLMRNEKNRKLSLFGTDLDQIEEYFGYVYSTNYKGSFAQLAQAHRHRTLDYQMELLDEKEFFVPPIIADSKLLVDEWLGDMQLVEKVNPQGEIVKINESGKYDDFILKCKERLCSAAQLEIMNQTRETLLKYKKALEVAHNPLAIDIERYSHGARCTFPDFQCPKDCQFNEGKTLTRKI